MDDVTLRRVQSTLVEIAMEFRRVCRVLGLSYFLDSGTLLGAVRHGGFIPWDDDLDVGMLRDQYEEFLKKAPAVLGDNYFLQSWHTDQYYGLAFAKLRMKNTVYIEEAAQGSRAVNGFYIDIFPYDAFPNNKKDKMVQARQYELLRRSVLVKSGYTPWIMNAGSVKSVAKKIGYIPIKMFASLHSREELIRRYERNCKRYNHKKTGYLYEQAGASNYGKWVIPDRCFEELIDMKFEGEYFTIPVGYKDYLTAAYGDYNKLPPEEDRVNRHRIIKVQFPDESSSLE